MTRDFILQNVGRVMFQCSRMIELHFQKKGSLLISNLIMSSSSSSMPTSLNWGTLCNKSIIAILPHIVDVNKVLLDDAKMVELWVEFGKSLTIPKRLKVMQDYQLNEFVNLSLVKVAPVVPPPPPTEASSLTVTPSADGTIIKKKIRTCATCGSTEHNKRRCPVKCSNCNAEGHKSKNCPLPKPEKKRKAETDEAVDGTAQPQQKKKKMKVAIANDGSEGLTSQPAPPLNIPLHPEFNVAGIPPPVTSQTNLVSSPMSATPTPIQEDADE